MPILMHERRSKSIRPAGANASRISPRLETASGIAVSNREPRNENREPVFYIPPSPRRRIDAHQFPARFAASRPPLSVRLRSATRPAPACCVSRKPALRQRVPPALTSESRLGLGTTPTIMEAMSGTRQFRFRKQQRGRCELPNSRRADTSLSPSIRIRVGHEPAAVGNAPGALGKPWILKIHSRLHLSVW